MKTRILIILLVASFNLAAQNDTTNDTWENNGNDISTPANTNIVEINASNQFGLRVNSAAWLNPNLTGEKAISLSLGRVSGDWHYPAFHIYTEDSGGHNYLYNKANRWGTHFYWTRGSNDGEQYIAQIGGDGNTGQYFQLYNESHPDDPKVVGVNLRTKNTSYFNPEGDFGVAIGQTSTHGYKFSVDGKSWLFSETSGVLDTVLSIGRRSNIPLFYIKTKSGNDYAGNALYTHADHTDSKVVWTRNGDTGEQSLAKIEGNPNAGQSFSLFGNTADGTENIRVQLSSKEHSFINPTDNSKGLGIGTTVIPVGFRLAVDGKIIAEEVCVKPSDVWPDYVFKPSYNLMSIEAKEAFTKQNFHLPSIESEAVVSAEGVNIGNSHADLLKEVEEAHLYIFQLNNELKNTQQQMKSMQQSIELLTSKAKQ